MKKIYILILYLVVFSIGNLSTKGQNKNRTTFPAVVPEQNKPPLKSKKTFLQLFCSNKQYIYKPNQQNKPYNIL